MSPGERRRIASTIRTLQRDARAWAAIREAVAQVEAEELHPAEVFGIGRALIEEHNDRAAELHRRGILA